MSGDTVGTWGTWDCNGDANQAFVANRSSLSGAARCVHNQQCLHRFQPRKHGHEHEVHSYLLLALRPCPEEAALPGRARLVK